MAINLEKGQRQSIDAPKFTVGLGWDSNSSSTGEGFDLDASVFLVGANGKIPNDNHFVYYNNLKSPDGAVIHTGDNLTGEGDGDDEIRKVWKDKPFPASTLIPVPKLAIDGMLIEVDATAFKAVK